jgi:hypothetical protein
MIIFKIIAIIVCVWFGIFMALGALLGLAVSIAYPALRIWFAYDRHITRKNYSEVTKGWQ